MSAELEILASWGKSRSERVHPLVCHALDTAAVARRGLELFLGPRCRDELLDAFRPLGDSEEWVAFLCGVHDVGKVCPAFQGLAFDVSSARFGAIELREIEVVRRQPGLGRRVDTPHGLVTEMQVRHSLLAWGASRATAGIVAGALGGHHGYFPDAAAILQTRREVNSHGRDRWRSLRDEVLGEVLRLRGLPDPTGLAWGQVRLSTGAALALAALTTLSDWIASDTANFPFAEPDDLVEYAKRAVDLAEAAVARLDWKPWSPPASFAAMFPAAPARPVQLVVEHMTAKRSVPTMVVVEAPTGEGKTKAALQAAAALSTQLRLAGVYVAMPTQATSNQAFVEMDELFKGDVSVRLIHSNAAEILIERATTPENVGDDGPEGGDVAAQEWFTRKKNLLAAVGVGTVDQLLKGAIRSGHVFIRLVALTNKVIVIDEVHAYDTYMSTLLDRLLSWLGAFGVSVVLLSATLPERRREELVASWRSGLLNKLPKEVVSPTPSRGFPRVTVADAGDVVVEPADLSRINEARETALVRMSDDEVAEWACTEALAGRGVAVVHNLVKRAVATHDAIARRLAALPGAERPKLVLLTGRLASRERREIEADLHEWFGEKGSRPAAIVVGTQVLEHGLDLDFDAMVSDLAPVDSLIQRIGRIMRHRPVGPGVAPELRITGVQDSQRGPVFPRYLDRVYAPMIMLRTWALLRARTSLVLPDEVPKLIDAVYGPAESIPCPDGWDVAWQTAITRLERAQEESKRQARLMYLPHPAAVEHLSELTHSSKNPSKTRENTRRT